MARFMKNGDLLKLTVKTEILKRVKNLEDILKLNFFFVKKMY